MLTLARISSASATMKLLLFFAAIEVKLEVEVNLVNTVKRVSRNVVSRADVLTPLELQSTWYVQVRKLLGNYWNSLRGCPIVFTARTEDAVGFA